MRRASGIVAGALAVGAVAAAVTVLNLPEAESSSRGYLLSPLPEFKSSFRAAETKAICSNR